jgi:SIR2-like protein
VINRRVVLILGAGASIPFGFPSGIGLYKEVLEQPRNSAEEKLLNACGVTYERCELFKQNLRHSGRTSVDAFLETRPDLMRLGKPLMALALMKHEHLSALFAPEKKGENWYDYLFERMLTPDIDAFGANNVSFITYNYDRSLEMYLGTALEATYGASMEDIAKQLSRIRIIHLHGKMGNLPFEGGQSRSYSAELTEEDLKIGSGGIKIIHESIDKEPQFEQAHEVLSEAQMICFLGFGYHETNISRLRLSKLSESAFCGTTYGMVDTEEQALQNWFSNRLSTYRMDILSFLRESGIITEAKRPIFR